MSVTRRPDRPGWWVRLKIGGRWLQRYGGPKKDDARDLEVSLKKEFVPTPESQLRKFVEEIYWPAQMAKLTDKARQREWGILTNHVGPFFDGQIAAISPQRLLEYVRHRKASRASSDSIRKELNVAHHIIRRALALDLITKDPFQKLERGDVPKPSPGRIRYLSQEEWKQLLFHLPEEHLLFFLFLINTGARRGDAFQLEHSDLDLVQGIARVGRDKRGKPKIVPLSPFLVKMLKKRTILEGNPRVFWQCGHPESFSRVFRKALRRAGIQNCRLHDLRHSFASQLAMHGVPIQTIQGLLGHEDPRMTARYSHLSPEHLAASVAALKGIYKGRVN